MQAPLSRFGTTLISRAALLAGAIVIMTLAQTGHAQIVLYKQAPLVWSGAGVFYPNGPHASAAEACTASASPPITYAYRTSLQPDPSIYLDGSVCWGWNEKSQSHVAYFTVALAYWCTDPRLAEDSVHRPVWAVILPTRSVTDKH